MALGIIYCLSRNDAHLLVVLLSQFHLSHHTPLAWLETTRSIMLTPVEDYVAILKSMSNSGGQFSLTNLIQNPTSQVPASNLSHGSNNDPSPDTVPVTGSTSEKQSKVALEESKINKVVGKTASGLESLRSSMTLELAQVKDIMNQTIDEYRIYIKWVCSTIVSST